MTLQLSAITPNVIIHNGRAVTTSRAIGGLDCSTDFRLLKIKETSYTRQNPNDGDGISTRGYQMTKDGFIFLVMGFTGKNAAQFKEACIAELAMPEWSRK